MKDRRPMLAAVAIATGLLTISLAVPALGGPSLKKLVQKEVAKQLAGKTGPQGPQGGPGATGATGAPGDAGTPPAVEQFRVVGSPGEPPRGDGGQGDCAWNDAGAASGNFQEIAFYKDNASRVHVVGTAQGIDDVGGDASCNTGTTGEKFEDWRIFTLPAGYRPDKVQTLPVVSNPKVSSLVIGSDEPTAFGPDTIPAGAVIAFPGGGTMTFPLIFAFEASFRAAG